jgi:hypothetical protein
MSHARLIVTNLNTGNKEVFLKNYPKSSDLELSFAIGTKLLKYYKNQIPFSVEYGYYSSGEDNK